MRPKLAASALAKSARRSLSRPSPSRCMADVTAAVSFTIPVDGWGEDDSSPGYFYCDIPIAGLLATDIVDVTVLPEFYDVAGAVGFIATESLEGKLRLRAAKAPTEKISAQYHITSTVKYTDAQEGGT